METRSLVAYLESQIKWVQSIDKDPDLATPSAARLCESLVVGCFQLQQQAGVDPHVWMWRMHGRQTAILTMRTLGPAQRRALRQLLALTLCIVGVSTWIKNWELGALPREDPKELSPAHKKQMQDARAAARERQDDLYRRIIKDRPRRKS